MSEVPTVTQAIGGSEEDLNGAQLDHSYIRPQSNQSCDDDEESYIELQPVSRTEVQQPSQDQNHPPQYSFASIPQVGLDIVFSLLNYLC